MTTGIVRHDVHALIEEWIQTEQDGVEFPVPFDTAWGIAGYSTKANAKRGLKGLREGKHFSSEVMKNGQRGRSSELIKMSCDAFKHFCLLAKTDEGDEIREYFIEAEKKWKLVEKVSPQFAQEVEILHLKIELAKQEAIRAKADQKTIELRHYIVNALPEPVQQKILGYTEIKQVEYRDRVIQNDQVIRDGGTINKTEMCKRLGLVTKSGAPDYKALNKQLDQLRLPSEAWQMTVAVKENLELRADYWPMVERKWLEGGRNLYLGE
jgi:phage anti-repressor protein